MYLRDDLPRRAATPRKVHQIKLAIIIIIIIIIMSIFLERISM